nr:hypothetical protein [Ancylobacter crimeensis]
MLLAGTAALPAAAQGFRGPWEEMGPPGASGRPGAGPYAPYETTPARRPGGPDGPGMDPGAVVEMLRGRGFSNIEVVRQRGAMIIVEANGPRGERVQLVVDAPSGAISGMKVIGFGDRRY